MVTAGKLLVAGIVVSILGGILFGIARDTNEDSVAVAGIVVMSIGGALAQVALIAYGVVIGLATDRARATRPRVEAVRADGNGAVV